MQAGDGRGSLAVVSLYGAVASQGKRPLASNCRFRISSASSRAIFPCSGESSGSAKPVRCIQRSQLFNCLACVLLGGSTPFPASSFQLRVCSLYRNATIISTIRAGTSSAEVRSIFRVSGFQGSLLDKNLATGLY